MIIFIFNKSEIIKLNFTKLKLKIVINNVKNYIHYFYLEFDKM